MNKRHRKMDDEAKLRFEKRMAELKKKAPKREDADVDLLPNEGDEIYDQGNDI